MFLISKSKKMQMALRLRKKDVNSTETSAFFKMKHLKKVLRRDIWLEWNHSIRLGIIFDLQGSDFLFFLTFKWMELQCSDQSGNFGPQYGADSWVREKSILTWDSKKNFLINRMLKVRYSFPIVNFSQSSRLFLCRRGRASTKPSIPRKQ